MLALGASLWGRAAVLLAQTSSGSLRRVGVLAPSTRAKEDVILAPFFDQMRQLGWVEGQNIQYDRVYAGDEQQMLGRLAIELVARQPEVIYAPVTPATIAASRQRRRSDRVRIRRGPSRCRIRAKPAHPGGNVTGMSSLASRHWPQAGRLAEGDPAASSA
jgi:putative ABC transport system substrate-binding protein